MPVNAAPEPRKACPSYVCASALLIVLQRTAPGDVVPSTAGRNKLARMGLPVKGTAQAEKVCCCAERDDEEHSSWGQVEQLGAKFAEEDEKKRQRYEPYIADTLE